MCVLSRRRHNFSYEQRNSTTVSELALTIPASSLNSLSVEPGSFRDRNGRVYVGGDAVYRGISKQSLEDWQKLSSTKFFANAVQHGEIVQTEQIPAGQAPLSNIDEPWAAVLKHQKISFISYPYEWSFGMLRAAALLQLDLLEKALQEDMTMKDASSFNIQWFGTQPVFIDIGSFESLVPGTPWVGYKQFCKLFLYPLFLQAYKDVGFHSFLRGNIDGIDAEDLNKIFSSRDLLRKGILMDVFLQAKMQKKFAETTHKMKDDLKASGFRKEMIKANLQRLTKIVCALSWKRGDSEWANYATNTSYTDEDTERKISFVRKAVQQKARTLVWDLGANTGRYSRIAAENSKYVIAMDSDHLAVERLYQQLKTEKNRTILPLVMNLADSSPNLGWRGLERKSLEGRGKPDLILCLALIHHIVISANIPVHEFINWLASLGGDLIIEFVTKQDPMTKVLLRNKEDQYYDYELGNFERILSLMFTIVNREVLSSGTRYLFYAKKT